uniref:SJCHGC02364 protein n=1 Tax=Schistosoma japonicum TaxID=6182 RepID=Q5DEN7_SCHJA|nr:SJCHGC02364 protein [Schistosoma japonicum]
MAENHSNNNDNLHEVDHSDHSNKTKPTTDFTDKVIEGEDGLKFDTPSSACLTMTHSDQITNQPCVVQLSDKQGDLTEQSDTTSATGHLDTSSDNTNLTDLKHELNDDNRTQDADSPVVSRHISTVPGCDSEIFTDNLLMKSVSDVRHHAVFVTDIDSGCNLSPVSSTVQGENTTGEGFTDSSCDLLSAENQFFFPPMESVKSILDLSPEISVASAETVHVNSILPESYATDLDESSKSKASLNSSPSSVMTSPLITSKSSLKIQRDLKSPSNFDARIIKPSSLPFKSCIITQIINS